FKKAYTIEMYLAENTFSADILTNVAKRIEVTSHTNIARERFVALVQNWISRNEDTYEARILETKLSQINNILVDLKPGDLFSVTYVPNEGTYFVRNAQTLGRIEGEDFSRTFFAIWVGERPLDDALKTSLLAYAK
ncbi:MAG: chalcone isomerase family protein, partial [Candidatus Omnitrophica bacterium]|nr:chalcone isomerase family protein [Candidatus Omnitrophota bacterium]